MERGGAETSLHERLVEALERAAEAHEHSHAIMARQHALTIAIRETCEALAQQRSERSAHRRRTETDSAVPGSAPARGSRYQQ